MPKKPELIPFAITTDLGHYVVLQCTDKNHAGRRYLQEESRRGYPVSIEKVD